MKIQDLMKRLTTEDVIQILEDSGYGINEELSAKYNFFDGTNHVFSIQYNNEGKLEKGSVFVTIDKQGNMTAEF